mgnify:CR=1 FL=1
MPEGPYLLGQFEKYGNILGLYTSCATGNCVYHRIIYGKSGTPAARYAVRCLLPPNSNELGSGYTDLPADVRRKFRYSEFPFKCFGDKWCVMAYGSCLGKNLHDYTYYLERHGVLRGVYAGRYDGNRSIFV